MSDRAVEGLTWCAECALYVPAEETRHTVPGHRDQPVVMAGHRYRVVPKPGHELEPVGWIGGVSFVSTVTGVVELSPGYALEETP